MRTLRRGSLYLTLGAVFTVLATLGDAATAQSGPPVRIIVPFPPGGSADVLALVLSR
jgi:tripartite-type tricarboxylate transporter receptor subunit TctC